MHYTLITAASAVAIASLFASAIAGVAPRQAVPSGGFTCTDDTLYKGFFSNTEISYDVQTFCSSDLGLSDSTVCDHSLTTRTTVYPSASYQTITTTATTTSYDSTVTVTKTGGVILDLSKKLKARKANPAPEAQITTAPQLMRKALGAGALDKRQSPEEIVAEVASACECGYLAGIVTTDTDYVATCYPYTMTVSDGAVVYQATTVTAFTTVEGSATTITVTQNSTANIVSVALNTSTPVWTGSWTGLWNGSWTEWSGPPTASPTITSDTASPAPTTTGYSNSSESSGSAPTTAGESSSSESSSLSSSGSSPISPLMQSTITSGNWNYSTTVTSSISSPTTQPSGCPYINGTTYSPPGSCNVYTRICGLSFAPEDFYGISPYFSSPELCAGLCDADSNGDSPCLGIVWNTSAVAGSHQSNCAQLQSLGEPIVENTAIAFILTGENPNCDKVVNISSSVTTPISPTGTGNTSYSEPTWSSRSHNHNFTWSPTGTGRPSYSHIHNTTWSGTTGTKKPSYTHSDNSTWSPTGTWNYTRGPTGTGYSHHSYNHTHTPMMNSTTGAPYMTSPTSYSNATTTPYSNTTTSMSSPNMSMSSTSAGTISAIQTSNSTCAATTTVMLTSTQMATLVETTTVFDWNTTSTEVSGITTVTVTITTTEFDTITKGSSASTTAAPPSGRYKWGHDNWRA